jgi:hypothetical protein
VSFLLCFPKRGNSNTEERKQIMNRFIRLFGKSVVYMLVDVAVLEQRAGGLAEPPHKGRNYIGKKKDFGKNHVWFSSPQAWEFPSVTHREGL